LQAEQTQLPQLKKVIAVSGTKVVMADSLHSAVGRVVEARETAIALEHKTTGEEAVTQTAQGDEALKHLTEHMRRFEEAQKRGDWVTMEREWQSIKEAVRKMQSQKERTD
jgi:uncharacterized membrane protein (UPF0182 family)